MGNGLAEEVAEQSQTTGPEESANSVVGGENAITHPADAGHDRREGADNRQKAREKDGLGAVAIEKCFCFLNMRRSEPERFGTGKNSRTNFLAEEIADGVTGDGRDEKKDNEWNDGEITLRGKEAGREEKTVAGQEETDEKTGLGEDDSAEAEITGGFNE